MMDHYGDQYLSNQNNNIHTGDEMRMFLMESCDLSGNIQGLTVHEFGGSNCKSGQKLYR